jgi:hypothetical protein
MRDCSYIGQIPIARHACLYSNLLSCCIEGARSATSVIQVSRRHLPPANQLYVSKIGISFHRQQTSRMAQWYGLRALRDAKPDDNPSSNPPLHESKSPSGDFVTAHLPVWELGGELFAFYHKHLPAEYFLFPFLPLTYSLSRLRLLDVGEYMQLCGDVHLYGCQSELSDVMHFGTLRFHLTDGSQQCHLHEHPRTNAIEHGELTRLKSSNVV